MTLKAVDVVKSTAFEGERAGIHDVRVELERDAPELVAGAVVGAGLGLRRLEPVETDELEAKFLRLTGARA